MERETPVKTELQIKMRVRLLKSMRDNLAMPNGFIYLAGQVGKIEDIVDTGEFRSIYVRLTTGELISVNNQSDLEQI